MLGVASAAVIVAASSGIVGFTTESVRAQTTTTVAHNSDFERGYADLVGRVQPAVVNVPVERTKKAAQRQPDAVQRPRDAPLLRALLRRRSRMPGSSSSSRSEPRARRGLGLHHQRGRPDRHQRPRRGRGRQDQRSCSRTAQSCKAKLKGIDEKTDLALIKIDAGKPLPYVDLRRQRQGPRRRQGARGRQPVRPRRHRHRRHRLGDRPRDRRRPLRRLHPDRRADQPRQLGRPDLRPRGRGHRRQHARSSRRPAAASASASPSRRTSPSRSSTSSRTHGTVDARLARRQHPAGRRRPRARASSSTSPHGALVSEVEPDSPAANAGVKTGRRDRQLRRQADREACAS